MNHRDRQSGTILAPVVLIGLIVTLSVSALIYHDVYVEQAALENRLAEMRAYWMTMGHFRYALSRQRMYGLCNLASCGSPGSGSNNLKDVEKVPVLQGILDEISSLRTFTYPEEAGGYSIKISVVAATDDDPARHNTSGHLMMTSSYPIAGVSTLPVLAGLAQRFTPYQLRFCTSLTTLYAQCGPVTANNNNGKTTGLYSVKRLYRLNSAS